MKSKKKVCPACNKRQVSSTHHFMSKEFTLVFIQICFKSILQNVNCSAAINRFNQLLRKGVNKRIGLCAECHAEADKALNQMKNVLMNHFLKDPNE